MPELPEVDTVAAALDQALRNRRMIGARFFSRVRYPFDAAVVENALAGKRISAVRRRAKYIVVEFDCNHGLLAHLGMTGSFRLEKADAALDKHDRLALILDNGDELRYADARRFGFVKLVSLSGPGCDPDELRDLGWEPLERRFTAAAMAERAAGRKCPVKVFIMDQTVVVGVGNIYASEALFAAGVDPRREAGSLTLEEWKGLASSIKRVLKKALRAGGSTIRNYRTVNGAEGGFQRALRIYGKTGGKCPHCGAGVETVRLGGRSTFFCPRCQV